MTRPSTTHRNAVLIPAPDGAAGEYAVRILQPHASDRVLAEIIMAPVLRERLAAVAAAYRDQYVATGLIGGRDGSPGRLGAASSGLERMGEEETAAWRAHNAARASMRPAAAVEVDRVVLDDRDDAVRVPLLIDGLLALAGVFGRAGE